MSLCVNMIKAGVVGMGKEQLRHLLEAILLSALPVSEIRGGIPLAFYYGINNWIWLLILVNIIIIPLVFFFLDTANNILLNIKWYKRWFNKKVERTRRRVKPLIEKHGFWGLTLFVGVPLPFTGAYTGTLAAWFLGMNRKKAFLAIAIGVLIASFVVITATLLTMNGVHGLSLFIKTIKR